MFKIAQGLKGVLSSHLTTAYSRTKSNHYLKVQKHFSILSSP